MRQHQSADNQNENKSRLLFAVIISAVLLIVGGSIAVGMIVFNNSHPSVRTEPRSVRRKNSRMTPT